MNDFSDLNQTGIVQNQIFGLNYSKVVSVKSRADSDRFARTPSNTADILYGLYKYFFHVSVPLKSYNASGSFSVEKNMAQPICSTVYQGNFTANDTLYNFWICNSTVVFFDTDLNLSADKGLIVGQSFNSSNVSTNLTVRYINYPSQVSLSVGPNYEFKDFLITWTAPGQGQGCPQGNAWGQYYNDQVTPVDGNMGRIALVAHFSQDAVDLPVVILNGTFGRTAWIADFTNNPNFKTGCDSVAPAGDDNKLLLASLLMWASSKRIPTSSSETQHGFLIPYINVQNSDMYEVYQFNLGLKSPFSS